MKKFRILNILLILTFVFMMPVVHAHEIDVRNDAIKIEKSNDKIYSGSKILVDLEKLKLAEDTEYVLYYQYVAIDNDSYNSYVEIDNTQQEEIKKFLSDNKLEDIFDGTEEQQKEYNDIVIPYEKSKEALLPSFVESNWIKTTDATAKLDLTKVPENKLGFQPYVLWMKVEASDNTYYGEQVVTAKKQAVDPEASEESPGTGDEIMLIALGAIAVAGIMVVSYKKANA